MLPLLYHISLGKERCFYDAREKTFCGAAAAGADGMHFCKAGSDRNRLGNGYRLYHFSPRRRCFRNGFAAENAGQDAGQLSGKQCDLPAEPERHNFWERYHISAGVRNGCPAKTIRGQRRPDRGTADGTVGHYHRYAPCAHGGGTGTGTENHFSRPRDGGRRHRDPYRRSTAGLRSRGKGLQSGLREGGS